MASPLLYSERLCEQCGQPFQRPRCCSERTWQGRRYCSPTCSQVARRKETWREHVHQTQEWMLEPRKERGRTGRGPLEKRLWPRIDRSGECWIWTGGTTPAGYGTIMFEHKQWTVHSLVYTLLVGPIPEGLELDHLCRIPRCCRPEHLEPVTHKVNMERGLQATQTHCKHGHEYTPENTMRTKEGHRECRTCRRARYIPHPREERTHCAHGHALEGRNKMVLSSGPSAGRWMCRTCCVERNRRLRHARRAQNSEG